MLVSVSDGIQIVPIERLTVLPAYILVVSQKSRLEEIALMTSKLFVAPLQSRGGEVDQLDRSIRVVHVPVCGTQITTTGFEVLEEFEGT